PPRSLKLKDDSFGVRNPISNRDRLLSNSCSLRFRSNKLPFVSRRTLSPRTSAYAVKAQRSLYKNGSPFKWNVKNRVRLFAVISSIIRFAKSDGITSFLRDCWSIGQ